MSFGKVRPRRGGFTRVCLILLSCAGEGEREHCGLALNWNALSCGSVCRPNPDIYLYLLVRDPDG